MEADVVFERALKALLDGESSGRKAPRRQAPPLSGEEDDSKEPFVNTSSGLSAQKFCSMPDPMRSRRLSPRG
jgi:hypothetical protein